MFLSIALFYTFTTLQLLLSLNVKAAAPSLQAVYLLSSDIEDIDRECESGEIQRLIVLFPEDNCFESSCKALDDVVSKCHGKGIELYVDGQSPKSNWFHYVLQGKYHTQFAGMYIKNDNMEAKRIIKETREIVTGKAFKIVVIVNSFDKTPLVGATDALLNFPEDISAERLHKWDAVDVSLSILKLQNENEATLPNLLSIDYFGPIWPGNDNQETERSYSQLLSPILVASEEQNPLLTPSKLPVPAGQSEMQSGFNVIGAGAFSQGSHPVIPLQNNARSQSESGAHVHVNNVETGGKAATVPENIPVALPENKPAFVPGFIPAAVLGNKPASEPESESSSSPKTEPASKPAAERVGKPKAVPLIDSEFKSVANPELKVTSAPIPGVNTPALIMSSESGFDTPTGHFASVRITIPIHTSTVTETHTTTISSQSCNGNSSCELTTATATFVVKVELCVSVPTNCVVCQPKETKVYECLEGDCPQSKVSPVTRDFGTPITRVGRSAVAGEGWTVAAQPTESAPIKTITLTACEKQICRTAAIPMMTEYIKPAVAKLPHPDASFGEDDHPDFGAIFVSPALSDVMPENQQSPLGKTPAVHGQPEIMLERLGNAKGPASDYVHPQVSSAKLGQPHRQNDQTGATSPHLKTADAHAPHSIASYLHHSQPPISKPKSQSSVASQPAPSIENFEGMAVKSSYSILAVGAIILALA